VWPQKRDTTWFARNVFRFLELSLYGWDFWQQVRVPLDRDVVLLVGPNGCGKTTFLDSIRQLLAARKLSSKRRLQQYLRQPDQPALIRAVVSNEAAEGGQQPFHKERIFTPEVTLACALVVGSSGTAEKRFAIRPGRASVAELQEMLLGSGRNFVPPEQYERALANAGVSRSLMAVLAIEQGRTHELFELSPRDLFVKVLDMLGDKAILDRYSEARRRYGEAKGEVERQTRALLAKQAELATLIRQVEARNRWEQQRDKVLELEERLPASQYQQLSTERQDLESKIQELRTKVRKGEAERLTWASAFESAREAIGEAERSLGNAKKAAETATEAWGLARADAQAASKRGSELRGLADEARRIPAADVKSLEAAHDQAGRRRAQCELALIDAEAELVRREQEVTELRLGNFVYPDPVARTLNDLQQAGVTHKLLCSAVDTVDDSVADSVEAAIGDARFALLIAPADEERVIHVARAHRFPGPVYCGPYLDAHHAAGPLRLAAGAPSWLPEILEGISFATDGSFRDRRGHWLERSNGRYLGMSALKVALTRAEERLANVATLVEECRRALQLSEAEVTQAAHELEVERRRWRLLEEIAELPVATEREITLAAALAAKDQLRRRIDADREAAAMSVAEVKARFDQVKDGREQFERQLDGEIKGLRENESRLQEINPRLDAIEVTLTPELRRLAEARALDSPATVEADLGRARDYLAALGQPPPPEVRLESAHLQSNVSELERHVKERTEELEAAAQELDVCRTRYMEVVSYTLREYRGRAEELGRGADVVVEMDLPTLRNDDAVLDEARISPRFGFDGKEPLPMGDSSFSGGQQVVAGLILLMAMAETEGRGFFLLDEPFAHLSIDRVDNVGKFLRASKAQFIITAPTTLDRGQLDPASMVIVLQKKRKDSTHAPAPLVAMS
jgi:chromosome segregation ATPase